MPWDTSATPILGPTAIPDDMDLNPERHTAGPGLPFWSSFRDETTIGAALGYQIPVDERGAEDYDPEYRAFDDIQGTKYEPYWQDFVGARSRTNVLKKMADIDEQLQRRQERSEAGWRGIVADIAVQPLDPVNWLPGGAIIKGAKEGISIGKTALSIGGSAAAAAALQEAALQDFSSVRTVEESAFSIGGTAILGAALGGLVGKMSAAEAKAVSSQVETAIRQNYDFTESMRSLSAQGNQRDFTLRREGVFQAINHLPVARGLVRSDPILRSQLSPLEPVRRAVADLAETPLEYRVNEAGQSVREADGSVAGRIKFRENTDKAKAMSHLRDSFAAYWSDGPVGTVGTLTAPITARFAQLSRMTEKMNLNQFLEQVGMAMRRGDKHPIAQVQSAADALRRDIFDKIKGEATELGIFDKDMKVKNADSYFTRVYNVERIVRHFGDGTRDDILPVLEREFGVKRTEAQKRIAALEEGKVADADDLLIAERSDAEVKTAVREAVQAIIGLKPGEHHMVAALSKPMHARVLDVNDLLLEPWLESRADVILGQYFRAMVPTIEMTRTFGDRHMTGIITEIKEATTKAIEEAKGTSAKAAAKMEGEKRLEDIEGMRDRLLGHYGAPANPRAFHIQAGRLARGTSYMALLGMQTISAMTDVANFIGRVGILGTFGSMVEAAMHPQKMFKSARAMADFGSTAEWWLNSRAISMAEMFDPYGSGTKLERVIGEGGRQFSIATAMVPWNVGWKSIAAALHAKQFWRAIDAVRAGKPTKKHLRALGANDISPEMVERIGKQLDQHGLKDGGVWFPNGRLWTDRHAFEAMGRALNREMDMTVVTPGLDKPLFMSTELGKVIGQFKTMAFSMHHRVLLAGIQRADADVLGQVVTSIILGGLVSNIRADISGHERKTGGDFWVDAFDKSGVSGWAFELHNMIGMTGAIPLVTGGRFDGMLGKELPSRYQSRNGFYSLFGPSVDLIGGIGEGIAGLNSVKKDGSTGASYKDIRNLMRVLPGYNHPVLNIRWLSDQLNLMQGIEDAAVRATGARPREDQ